MPKNGEAKTNRTVVYPQVEVGSTWGPNALTADHAGQLLGWEAEDEVGGEEGFGDDYTLTDRRGVKVRLTNNIANRPIYPSVVETLVQEVLRRRWRFNGEPIIIGKTAIVLNGQHTLIAVKLAEQDRTGEDAARWQKEWPEPICIEKIVVFGVEEGDDVVNTMDICRSDYFEKTDKVMRRAASRATDYAIRLLWHRTGAGIDAFAPRRTHAESLDFLNRHPRLLKAVKHILEEDSSRGISTLISQGYAAALMYMMAASETDGDAYRAAEPPSEKAIVFTKWDEAAEFWMLLGSRAESLKAIRQEVVRSGEEGGGAHLNARLAVLCKAWGVVLNGGKPTPKELRLKWIEGERDGAMILTETPDLGGIDLGDPNESRQPSEGEVEAAKSEARARRANGEKPPPRPRQKKG